jgi:hypothetical protein
MAQKKTATKKKASTKKKGRTPADPITLELTLGELMHLRDLFSTMLPPDGKRSVSNCLAALNGTGPIEEALWWKVGSLCREVGVPIEDEAPDFVVTYSGPPTFDVFHFEMDPEDAAVASESPSPWKDSEDEKLEV